METKLRTNNPAEVLVKNVEALRKFLERGDPRKVVDKNGGTLLHWAALYGPVESVLLLLRYFDPNVADNFGTTPLHLAARLGRLDVARVLLQHGADPNRRGEIGLTPLHLAEPNCELVETLLQHGADPYAQDDFGDTPLHLIIRRLLGGDACVVESFIAYAGGDIANVQNHVGNTPLHEALEIRPGEEAALILIDYIKDVNARNKWGQTPLHLAVTWHARAVEKLLLRGADPNAQDANGETPLHYAARMCNIEVAALLISWGADVNAVNSNGETPFTVALRQCNPPNDELGMCKLCLELANLFLENGADPAPQ
jgi:ankyrin repeat protein